MMAVGDAPFDPWHLVHLLWGILLGIIMWLARKVMGDVDKLKDEKADKDEILARFDEVAENSRQLVQRIDSHYQVINSRLDALLIGMTKRGT